MLFYIKNENGIITEHTLNEDSARIMNLTETIDYYPIEWNSLYYTREGFEALKQTQEYKNQKEDLDKKGFEFEAKKLEEQSTFIEYKGKKFSLDEILFKSTIYNSVTDLYVYLKAEDKSLVKVLRATFLLIVAKAKANLKDVEEALYNASYDKTKSLEDNITAIKNIFNAIDKIFNG